MKVCPEILIFEIFVHGVHLGNVPRIFLATPTSVANI